MQLGRSEKLMADTHMVKKFAAFCGAQNFVIMWTETHSGSCAEPADGGPRPYRPNQCVGGYVLRLMSSFTICC